MNPQSSPCSPHSRHGCLVVFFPMRCNRKESNLTNSKHPLPLHRCLQAKSYHFHLKPFSPTHSFSWHQRRLMPNGRLSSRRGVLQLPRSSGQCSSRSSALRFPPSFSHSLRRTCPQCNLIHRGFFLINCIVPDVSEQMFEEKNIHTCAVNWFIKTFLNFQKQVPKGSTPLHFPEPLVYRAE